MIRAEDRNGPVKISVRCLGPAVAYHGERSLSFAEGTQVYEVTAPGYCLTHVYAQPNETLTIRMVPYDLRESVPS